MTDAMLLLKKEWPINIKEVQIFKAVKDDFIATLEEDFVKSNGFLLKQYFSKVQKEAVRDVVLNDKIRLDGRKTTEIRPIWSEIDYLPGSHGSAVFTRGETQSLVSVLLVVKMDEQRVDRALITDSEKFILHYNFPHFQLEKLDQIEVQVEEKLDMGT